MHICMYACIQYIQNVAKEDPPFPHCTTNCVRNGHLTKPICCSTERWSQ